MQAVIMAGGLGVRLRPFTYAIPKPLLPLGDITILEYTIQSLSKNGFTEIFLLTSYQHEKFERCSEYEDKYKIKLIKFFEKERMGTAGGIKLLKNKLNNDFLIMNGDLLVKMDYASMFNYHITNKADMTVGITKFSYKVPYGIIKLDHNKELIGVTEKSEFSSFISSGIYVLNSSVLELIENTNHMDMPELIDLARIKKKRLKTFDIGERWLDTGQLDDYERAVGKIDEWNKEDSTGI